MRGHWPEEGGVRPLHLPSAKESVRVDFQWNFQERQKGCAGRWPTLCRERPQACMSVFRHFAAVSVFRHICFLYRKIIDKKIEEKEEGREDWRGTFPGRLR